METREKIVDDMKKAMKAKDDMRKSVTRMLLSEFKYAETASKDEVLGEPQVISIVQKYHKRLVKSLVDFPESDQKNKIQQEINIVAEYLPTAPSTEEIAQVVERLCRESDNLNFGQLMKSAQKELGPFVDGRTLSMTIKNKLQTKDA